MIKFGVNFKWYLDGRNRKPEQKAISICLTEGNERKYFPIGIYVSDQQWNVIQKEKGGLYTKKADVIKLFGDCSDLDDIVDEMNDYENRFDKVCRELRDLNGYVDLKSFWERFTQPMINNGKLVVKELLEEMQTVKTDRKPNTNNMDWTAYDSLYKYYNKTTGKSEQQFKLTDIDPTFLKGYEKYKCHSTGVYTHFRQIRTLFNYAIERGYIPSVKYPFGKNKVSVNQAKTRNIALSNQSFQKLYYADQCDFLTDRQKESIMYLIASWCCNGCNPMDLLQLRHRDIVCNKITFTRTKTKGRIQTPKAIVIDVNDKLHQIIEQYGTTPNATGSNYIFPILSEGDSEEEISKKVITFRHNSSHIIRSILDKLGINVPVNYDVIRHTFATQHYNMNKNLKLLSEDLGHSNLQTTARYIDSIEVEDEPKVATIVRESVVSELANPYSKEEEL